jgi:transposase InsO family protein
MDDMTYIRLHGGWLYLVAVIDWFSRYVVSWELDQTTADDESFMADTPKRLIEADLPIRRISAHARREKSIRHAHISTPRIRWARRPSAACRAAICGAL